MNTTVHYINGQPMKEKDFAARMPCSMCEGGAWFDREDYYYDGEFDEPFAQLICNACLTKYRKPKLVPKYFRTNTLTDEGILIGYIVRKVMETRKTMTPQETEALQKAHDEFSATGKCKKHFWAKTNPAKTEEGTFVFKSCLVCLLGQVKHGGKVYQDQLPNLVSWIAHKGLSKEKEQKKKEDELIEAKIMADVSFGDLFDAIDTDVEFV